MIPSVFVFLLSICLVEATWEGTFYTDHPVFVKVIYSSLVLLQLLLTFLFVVCFLMRPDCCQNVEREDELEMKETMGSREKSREEIRVKDEEKSRDEVDVRVV